MGIKSLPEPLELSADDHSVLHQLRQGLHEEIIRNYESYMARPCHGSRGVDTARWKHLRSEGELHAYREREDAPPDERDSLAIQPQAWMAARSSFPRVLVVGTIPGTLDDILYAQTYLGTDSLRTNELYEKNADDDSAVLHVLEGPSADDPFRIASVNWFRRSFPIVRDRMVLAYADLRQSRLHNGERIGIDVVHSIRHDNFRMPKPSRVVRVECSIATVFRQYDGNRVEVYTIHFVDPKSTTHDSLLLADMANAFVVQEIVKSLLSMAAFTETALNKKLCYRVRERLRHRLQQRKYESMLSIDASGEVPHQCEQCDKKLCGLFKSSGHTCQLCEKLVCNRCIKKRELVVDATVVEKPFEFCDACIKQTRMLPAKEIALAEPLEQLDDEMTRLERKTKLSPTSASPTCVLKAMQVSPVS